MTTTITARVTTDLPITELADDELIVHVADLTITDPAIIAAVRGTSSDPEASLLDALRIGARALSAARIGGEAALIDEALLRIDTAVTDLDTAAHGRAEATSRELLDTVVDKLFAPGAPVAETLRRLDPANADGLATTLRTQIADQVAKANAASRTEINDQLTSTLRSITETVATQIGTIRQDLAAQTATRQMFTKTTLKGHSYEATVEACFGTILQRGELIESTGTAYGEGGGKVGDHILTITVDGYRHRIVVEDKSSRKSVPKLLAEARQAMENRDATKCIWVTNDVENVPGRQHLALVDRDIIIAVVDDENPDTLALELALASLRLDIAREQAASEAGTEAELHASIDAASRELGRLTESLGHFRNIRTGHTAAENGIAKAREQVDDLERALKEGIEALNDALTVAGTVEALAA